MKYLNQEEVNGGCYKMDLVCEGCGKKLINAQGLEYELDLCTNCIWEQFRTEIKAMIEDNK